MFFAKSNRRLIATTLRALALSLSALSLIACGGGEAESAAPSGYSNEQVADMLQAVMASDRKMYASHVMTRLIKKEKVQILDENGEPAPLKGSENWEKEYGKLPLPAQMFRMAAEDVNAKDKGFTYSLISSWPINKENKPKGESEAAGMTLVEETGEPWYGTETIGGAEYFVAIYGDRGVAPACVDCHNEHPDSPRTDFELDEIMGGVVIRIPMT